MDLVDPNYDFINDRSSPEREPYWDDCYPHEMLGYAPYDGILVSRALFGQKGMKSRYSDGQTMRFRTKGAREYLRFTEDKYPNTDMWGDCGAFTYVKDDVPPYTVDDIIDFYGDGQFTHGCSVDHIIFQFTDEGLDVFVEDKEVLRRQEICLENAKEFYPKSKKRIGNYFTPVGVVHGWSAASMAEFAKKLVKIGYSYIALGGMVPLTAKQIMSAYTAVKESVPSNVKIHILGFAKEDTVNQFINKGLDSADTTSPLISAFKDKRKNYYLYENDEMKYYAALRVPQMLKNSEVKKGVQSGHINLEDAIELEKQTLKEIRLFAEGQTKLENVITCYEQYWNLIMKEKASIDEVNAKKVINFNKNNAHKVLSEKPWLKCSCEICSKIGVEVILFRGNNRNRRRGFHNIHIYSKLINKLRKNGK